MTEIKEIPGLPPDQLSLSPEDIFEGQGYVYKNLGSTLGIEEIKFETNKQRALDPFVYNKPIENPNNPFEEPIEFVRDTEPREGYFPLALVREALRPPNHLYEIDDAVFCAVNRGTNDEPKWETRYFPKGSLDPQVWNDALIILGITEDTMK